MTEMTALDLARAAVDLDPENDAAHLRFYHLLADSELFLLLDGDPEDGAPNPALFALEEGEAVLAFDTEARLADFAEGPAPYAALPGRAVVAMLAGQGVALGLNLAVASSSYLVPAEAIDWLADTLDLAPEAGEAQPVSLAAPALPEGLMEELAEKLVRAAGPGCDVWVAKAAYNDGAEGHLLAMVGAAPEREAGLAKAVGEALAFSGLPPTVLDVAFLHEGDPLLAALRREGLRLDVVLEEDAPEPARRGPGMDPAKPPILR